jgi:hypothetical protein
MILKKNHNQPLSIFRICDSGHKTNTNSIESKKKKTRSNIFHKKILMNEITKTNTIRKKPKQNK